MLDDMRVNDELLDISSIRQLENADRVAGFFHRLRYDITERTNIPDYTVLGMSGEDMRQHINKIELIGKDPSDGDIVIYLLEVRSVTAKLRNDIARRFRERPENALLVLTTDYQELEFVLLERVVSKSQSRRTAFKQAIRPIPLTVNRLNPNSIALRVLKRFTFTEEDSAYQWEKLRSAYMLAEWSEEYFNNRALFSDYYLTERLTYKQITPEWREDVRPIGREVYKHLITARKTYSRQMEAVIRKGLFEPLFKLLGFHVVEEKAGADKADYLLYASDDQNKPLAAALTYVWNRNLDDVDESREHEEAAGGTPFEIPGAMVVSLLEKQTAPWVIVTNGKLWRLYSSTANNKATNYYEVDLEEAIAANDQITALKYWWLMFRRQAFTGFLDNLLKNSADYAKELGDRLKDRVFVEIFPQFAKGFIADMRTQGVPEADIDLDVVFSGTLTFLYRLMFILYAESLDLMPLNEVNGYQESSLYSLKRTIATKGDETTDENKAKDNLTKAKDNLTTHYKTSSSELYERLKKLFGAIDAGSDEMNIPTYNGGLFSDETESGQFLATYTIPDRYLALGLDRLTRDIDQKTQGLVFIDFKSLGVRQLGSIYEGLLEFKLKIAAEELAVIREKGKEIYQPAKQVKKQSSVTVAKGEVYLENDKQERKATGSYYTPDYIVKYIVRHTVGPVLDRKFEELEKRLRQAQKGYRDHAKRVEARQKSGSSNQLATLYWNSDEMRQLADDCLNIRVLDPAMGSGHFLVEVVDYISNRLIHFLNGWTENPVWAFLDQTRQDIIDDMERQHVTIDADRLTRVALLKRAVLKRCVYGVDLNQMAVELAKVSLWLDAFTLGAPLSFLDHHLKHGNSLIGAFDLSEVVAVGSKRWNMILEAAADMVSLAKRTDATKQQVDKSKADYEAVYTKLEDVKKYASVSIAAYFIKELDNYRRSKKHGDVIKQIAQIAYLGPSPDIIWQDLFDRTQTIAQENHFFHWKLEFPEVFIDLGKHDWAKDGGFDAVVGNPPYQVMENIDAGQRTYFYNLKPDGTKIYKGAESKANIYSIFWEASLAQLTLEAQLGMVTPYSWVSNSSFRELRSFLKTNATLRFVSAFDVGVFEDVGIATGIFIIQNKLPNKNDIVRLLDARSISVPQLERILNADSETIHNVQVVDLWQDDNIVNLSYQVSTDSILEKFKQRTDSLSVICDVVYGCKTADTNAFTGNEFIPYRNSKKLLLGEDIKRHEYEWRGRYLYYEPAKMIELHETARPGEEKRFEASEKLIVYRFLDKSNRFVSIYDNEQYYCLDSTYVVTAKNSTKEHIAFVQCLLNSNLFGFYNRLFAGVKVTQTEMDRVPIRRIDFTTPAEERHRLTQAIISEYDRGDHGAVLLLGQAALDAGQSDVLHDVLTHLAGRMIDLNNQKQAEVKRFLTWLESKLKIKPDKQGRTSTGSLSGTTGRVFNDYLGDYQKGQQHYEFGINQPAGENFYHYLSKNENKKRYSISLREVEGEIEHEYEQSLAVLLPLKHDLTRTDALIDKIVYKLYGLKESEIELIERPQYEQALAEAKAQVIADEKITDDEEKIDKIAEGILSASNRFFERVETPTDEEILDQDLPAWRTLPPDAPKFLLTGDYALRTFPDHMDFSSSVIPYTKAVEVAFHKLIFEPFRAKHTDQDCRNEFLQKFMQGGKPLTLGSVMIILSSSKETALRGFISRIIRDVDALATLLNDTAMRDVRNKAAHDEVLSRAEAQQTRTWAISILGMV